MRQHFDYGLLGHNTFGIDARCRRFIEFETTDEARRVATMLGSDPGPLLIIGAGSNLLLTRDFRGTVVHSAVKGIDVVGDDGDSVLVRVGSGETWDDVVALCVARGWHGAENLSLIPGEVGATAVQNIGAYGVEVASVIDSIEAVRTADGGVVTIGADKCGYGYRDSRFKHEWRDRFLVTHVTYRLSRRFEPCLGYGNVAGEMARRGIDRPTAADVRRVIIEMRREKLPDVNVEGNAGSFFMNPVVTRSHYEQLRTIHPDMPGYDAGDGMVKVPAAWLIEQCGWKGRTVGRAGVHARQALVLVNRGGATGSDIVSLSDDIRRDVERRFGIVMTPEVNIV